VSVVVLAEAQGDSPVPEAPVPVPVPVLVEAQVPVLAPAHVAHKLQSKPPSEAVCQGQGIDTKAQ